MKILTQGFASRVRRPWLLSLLAVMLAGALAAGWTWYVLRSQGREGGDQALQGLQIFGSLPDFSLTDRTQRKVTRADLLGTVWVANFIYTHCTDTCPLQSARMAALQKDFPGQPALRFVSITVDPRRDTPSVLAEYAARYEADRERWLFLTGHKETIYALITGGFRLSVEDPTDSAAPATGVSPRGDRADGFRWRVAARHAGEFDRLVRPLLEPVSAWAHSDSEFLAPPFLHSSWFVLVDRKAQIRGYYRTEAEQPMQQLRRDIRILLMEQ
jgi:cytochrome oxidase Cu insertion factor (SCO1/SenC/PrrC family)